MEKSKNFKVVYVLDKSNFCSIFKECYTIEECLDVNPFKIDDRKWIIFLEDKYPIPQPLYEWDSKKEQWSKNIEVCQ
jgi:hypothetical protein